MSTLSTSLHARARKLAAFTDTPGPEGMGARRRLKKLIDEYPELSYLDCERPMERIEQELGALSVGDRGLVRELCYCYEVAFTEVAGHAWIIGNRCDVQAVIERVEQYEPDLERFLGAATLAWLLVADLPRPVPRSEKPFEPVEMSAEVSVPEHVSDEEDDDDADPLDALEVPRAVFRMLEKAANKLWKK